jgi:hypothetical protein
MAKNYRKTRRSTRRSIRRSARSSRRSMRKTRARRMRGGSQEMQKFTSPLVVNQVRY